MAKSSRAATVSMLVVVSMAVLVAGMGIEGPLGIVMNVAAILGCVAAIVVGVTGGGRAAPGPEADD